MKLLKLFAVALLLVAPSTLFAQDHEDAMEHTDATAEITAASEAFEVAWISGDWDAVAGMYTDDAIAMPPGGEAVEGSEAIAAFMSTRDDGMVLDLMTKEVYSVEGAALEVGSWTMTGADGSHLDHGNYMVAWSHTDEGWKMARDMWNSNMAPSP